MTGYVIIDKTTGIVDHAIDFNDRIELDPNYPLTINQEIIIIDANKVIVNGGDIYDFTTLTFTTPPPLPIPLTPLEIIQARCTALEAMVNDLMF
jgi:hypothetical protein